MHAANIALARAEWQPVLFAEQPTRIDLLKLQAGWLLTPVTIRIHRNHAFEHVASATVPWFAWWNQQPHFLFSDYDDSLSFGFPQGEHAHLEIIWVDLSRYAGRFESDVLIDWLGGRLAMLRSRISSPIILAATGMSDGQQEHLAKITRSIPATRLADLRPLAEKLGSRFYDERAAKFSGTRLSDAANVLVARELACHWAPAMLRPRFKAVALDLDNTLFDGVLGEDGNDGVRLTSSHRSLQESLVHLREQGVFLALISRNEAEDVQKLFQQRTDFPLRWEHFTATAVNWNGKADNLRLAAQSLRIGVDAIILVDDNPGEIAAVASELPSVGTLHATPEAANTQRALEFFPGLWAWERSAADAVRASDLEAGTERSRIAAEAPDPMEYLRTLQVKIWIEVTPKNHLSRLHELSQKTNQFNLNLERLSEVELAQMLDAADHRIAMIGLSDRLSDSGLIGLVIARREGDALVVRELTVSCRALGRRLENLMIAEALRAILAELPAGRVEFLHQTGPRNGPAREWLARLTGETLPPTGRMVAQNSLNHILATDYPVSVNIIHHE